MRRPWFGGLFVFAAEGFEFGLEEEGNVVCHADAVQTRCGLVRVKWEEGGRSCLRFLFRVGETGEFLAGDEGFAIDGGILEDGGCVADGGCELSGSVELRDAERRKRVSKGFGVARAMGVMWGGDSRLESTLWSPCRWPDQRSGRVRRRRRWRRNPGRTAWRA